MPSKKLIKGNNIIRVSYDKLPNNLLGVAVTVDKGDPSHSGIFIRYNGENHFFHYDTEDVVLVSLDLSNDTIPCFFKHLPFIPPELIPSIYSYFKIVENKALPKYGYYYTGSFYDQMSGDFKDEKGMPEVMSCVGFCLNVLKTCMLGSDFMKFTDWQLHNGITEDSILRYFLKIKQHYPDLKIEDYKKGVRRIFPIEYFTAGFGNNLPVEKVFTDKYVEEVKSEILGRV